MYSVSPPIGSMISAASVTSIILTINTYNYDRYSPLIVNIPELLSVPMKFSVSQV